MPVAKQKIDLSTKIKIKNAIGIFIKKYTEKYIVCEIAKLFYFSFVFLEEWSIYS